MMNITDVWQCYDGQAINNKDAIETAEMMMMMMICELQQLVP